MTLISHPTRRPSAIATAALLACCGLAHAGPVALADVAAQPAFHMAPAMLDEPSDVDTGGSNVSAHAAPRTFRLPAATAALATARLTPRALAMRLARSRASAVSTPAASTISAAVFTPAQIRAAYGLPELPAVGATIPAAMAATLGAGQTIYIVDSNDHPNALADLNRFSTKFGLPACASAPLTTASVLPLAAAGASCTFSVAYADANGALKSAAPAYDEGWASEIALDVQWAHAIAPLARLVLVESSSSMTAQLAGAIKLANRMGPGVVSMSFGAPEGSWMTALDANFAATGMTYVAASGDDGAEVNWPAASAKVLAVGGTSLAWSGSGTRREAAWSSSGGGTSGVVALPAWQSGLAMPGGSALKKRAVPDVAFNANPMTGQYVAFTAPGSSTTDWNAYGGTSIATPQWAGLVAVANAERAAVAKSLLGDVHAAVYAIAAVPGNYAAGFADITDGNDGACATCKAAAGWDQPTGWGTANARGLLPLLAGNAVPSTPVAVAPTVPGGTFNARTGSAVAQSLGIVAPAGVTTTYTLAGAPAGLAVDASGTLRWTSAAAGTWRFTATARTSAGASATGNYVLVVAANRAPLLAAASFSAVAGTTFSTKLAATDPDGDTLSYTLSGAPSGLVLSSAGTLAWAKPVKGTYLFRVTVKDPSGLSVTTGFTLVVASVGAKVAVR